MNYKSIFLIFALGVSGLSHGMPFFEEPEVLRARHEAVRARIEQLIEQKGNLNARMGDKFSNSPLLEMAKNEEDLDLLERLLKNGANPNVIGHDKWTALCTAALRGNSRGARLLLERNACPNSKGPLGTSLIVVAFNEHPSLDVVKVLLEYNADPNIRDGFSDTALGAAIRKLVDDISTLEYCRKENNSYMAERFQETIKTRKEIIMLLLQNGANPLITNKYGKNAINLAQEKGFDDIVLLLQERREQMIDRLARFLSHPEDGLPLPPEIIRVIAAFRYS